MNVLNRKSLSFWNEECPKKESAPSPPSAAAAEGNNNNDNKKNGKKGKTVVCFRFTTHLFRRFIIAIAAQALETSDCGGAAGCRSTETDGCNINDLNVFFIRSSFVFVARSRFYFFFRANMLPRLLIIIIIIVIIARKIVPKIYY